MCRHTRIHIKVLFFLPSVSTYQGLERIGADVSPSLNPGTCVRDPWPFGMVSVRLTHASSPNRYTTRRLELPLVRAEPQHPGNYPGPRPTHPYTHTHDTPRDPYYPYILVHTHTLIHAHVHTRRSTMLPANPMINNLDRETLSNAEKWLISVLGETCYP